MANGRIDELADIDIDSSEALALYLRRANRLYKDLTMEIGYSAEEILENLASVPGTAVLLGMDSRVRAKHVASPLVKAREATEFAGQQLVKSGVLFRRYFSEELGRSGRPAKPKFSFE